MVFKQTNKGGQMTHGKKMEMYGRILALQETMLHVQTKINKLNEQLADIKLQEAKDGSSKTSNNRSR